MDPPVGKQGISDGPVPEPEIGAGRGDHPGLSGIKIACIHAVAVSIPVRPRKNGAKGGSVPPVCTAGCRIGLRVSQAGVFYIFKRPRAHART
jgi:hypothetical protein